QSVCSNGQQSRLRCCATGRACGRRHLDRRQRFDNCTGCRNSMTPSKGVRLMRILVAAAAALLIPISAFAGDDVMSGTYGNTVVGKSAMFESHTHYNSDHSFTPSYSSAMGAMEAKGTWAIND